MISLNDVLLAMSNIPVDDPIAEIWGRGLQGGYKIIEYTGSLPITIRANGDALIDYRIYGADGDVGVATENLFDMRESSQGEGYVPNAVLSNNNTIVTGAGAFYISGYIKIAGDTRYYFYTDKFRSSIASICFYKKIDDDFVYISSITQYNRNIFTSPPEADYMRISVDRLATKVMLIEGSTAPTSYIPYGYKLPIAITDKNLLADNISQFGNGFINITGSISPPDTARKEKYSNYVSIVPNTNYVFAMANVFPGNPSGYFAEQPWRVIAFYGQNKTFIRRLPVVTDKASNPNPVTVTSPSDAFFARVSWRSYGSEECPVLVTNRNVYPVYIGENQLDAGEYVSYREQKIYRDVSGTLTPTDPPVSLSEIPTIKGETVIDYDGDPKPSQMYVKYKGKG